MIVLYWNSQLEKFIEPFEKVVGVQCHGRRPAELHINRQGLEALLDSTPEYLHSYLAKLKDALQ